MEVLSSRTILRPRDHEAALEFYGTTLGLAIAREYPGGTVFFAGQGLIEIAAHGGSDEPTRFPRCSVATGARRVRRRGRTGPRGRGDRTGGQAGTVGGTARVVDRRSRRHSRRTRADSAGPPDPARHPVARALPTPITTRYDHDHIGPGVTPPTRLRRHPAATSRNRFETLPVHQTFAVLLPPCYRTIFRCDR